MATGSNNQQSTQPDHSLTLIPGPIEFDDSVLSAGAHPSISHTAPAFVETFQSVLKHLRTLFLNSDPEAQPFVIAGGGTLGWDISASNFVEAGEKVLVLNTGFFSGNWGDCLRTYGADVTELKAEVGSNTSVDELKSALKGNKFKAVTITHVDTSTGVLQDLRALADAIRETSPETLIFADGVCSVGIEELRFDDWGLDYVLTGPQKGIGSPAGVSISVASARALDVLKNRKTPVPVYYQNLNRWLPVMKSYESGKPAYFSTPAIQNIYALHQSLELIAPSTSAVEERWTVHAKKSDQFKDTLDKLGLKILAKNRSVAAHGLSAVYLPEGVELTSLLPWFGKHNFTLAGGILPPIATKYFRVGHMGVSVYKYGHVDKLIALFPEAVAELTKK